MHAQAPNPRKSEWHDKFVHSGYLVGAILLHLIVFLMVGTWVIWKAPSPPPSSEFQRVSISPPPPPPPPLPSSGDAAANPQFEPQPVTMPVVAPPTVTMTMANSSFNVDVTKDLNRALSHTSQQVPQGSGLTRGGGEQGDKSGTQNATVFGSDSSTGNQLTGYFYDLKQTNDKKPTGMDLATYYETLKDYLHRSWDDSFFDRYYKSKSPLYADRIAISTRNSADAPKAFHLETEVQGGLWVIHYHAKVIPPAGRDYHFIGFADNVIVVRINGINVLDGSFCPTPLIDKSSVHEKLHWMFPSYIAAANNGMTANLKIGPSFHVDDGAAVDLDVLIGDDGGGCNFFLMIKSDDKAYDTLPDGTPKVPFFQLGEGASPTFKDDEEHPPFSTTPEPWKTAPSN